MSRKPLTDLTDDIVVMDGGMGTLLQRRGLPVGIPSCLWNLQRPEVVQQAHATYRKAGSEVLLTNTFCASRLLLSQLGLSGDLKKMNELGVRLARKAAGKSRWVLGDIGPTGVQGRPSRKTFSQRVEIFSEQIEILSRCDIDGILLETLGSMEEVLAGLEAVRCVSPKGVLVFLISVRRTQKGRLEPDPIAVAKAIKSFRHAGMVAGVNCSEGPEVVLRALRKMSSVFRQPLCAKPNAGQPRRHRTRYVYPVTPPQMGSYAKRFLEAGARWIGGCCGTDPDHIREIAKALQPSVRA